MRSKVVVMMTIAAGTLLGQYRDEYGRPGGYGDSRYDGPVDDGYAYDQVYDAPPPPPVPAYAYGYRRPPMPGPGCSWVDGYWSFGSGRYFWVNGYWARPPYGGAVWIAPRYNSGRFFAGFWSRPGRAGGGYGYGYRDHGGYGRSDHRYDRGRGYRR